MQAIIAGYKKCHLHPAFYGYEELFAYRVVM